MKTYISFIGNCISIKADSQVVEGSLIQEISINDIEINFYEVAGKPNLVLIEFVNINTPPVYRLALKSSFDFRPTELKKAFEN